MATTRFKDHILNGTTAARPAASAVPVGTVYASSTDGVVYQSDGTSWGTWLAAPAAGGGMAADTLWDTKGDLAVASAADTAAKLPVGSNNQVLTADSAQTLGVKWAAPAGGGPWTLLSTTTLGSAGTFDVSSISGSYNDLILMLIVRSADATTQDSIAIRFNADTAGNYYDQDDRAEGTTGSALQLQGATSAAGRASIPGSSVAPNVFGCVQVVIPGYASTTWQKMFMYEAFSLAATTSGGMRHNVGGGLWTSTAAITRVQVYNGNSLGNFVTGSTMRIYGRL